MWLVCISIHRNTHWCCPATRRADSGAGPNAKELATDPRPAEHAHARLQTEWHHDLVRSHQTGGGQDHRRVHAAAQASEVDQVPVEDRRRDNAGSGPASDRRQLRLSQAAPPPADRFMLSTRYRSPRRLLITADSGGSTSTRNRLWKVELQRFADDTGMVVEVCHFPTGTSKWNKIEHRVFSHITRNWQGVPLESVEVVVQLIGPTQTREGLEVHAWLDEGQYQKGRKVTDQELEEIHIRPSAFHARMELRDPSTVRANPITNCCVAPKKGSRRAGRPCVGKFSREIYHENPLARRRERPSSRIDEERFKDPNRIKGRCCQKVVAVRSFGSPDVSGTGRRRSRPGRPIPRIYASPPHAGTRGG